MESIKEESNVSASSILLQGINEQMQTSLVSSDKKIN